MPEDKMTLVTCFSGQKGEDNCSCGELTGKFCQRDADQKFMDDKLAELNDKTREFIEAQDEEHKRLLADAHTKWAEEEAEWLEQLHLKHTKTFEQALIINNHIASLRKVENE